MIQIRTDAGKVAASLGAGAPLLHRDLVKITRNAGRRLVTAVKSYAPVEDGDYRESWRMEFKGGAAGRIEARVGTSEPQGYRLEHGFHGADSLGRVYAQSPHPHVEPAAAQVGPVFVAEVEAAVALWVERQ